MRPELEEFIEYLEANPHLRPWQAVCEYFGYDVVMGWKFPPGFTTEEKEAKLVELAVLGIEDTFYL